MNKRKDLDIRKVERKIKKYKRLIEDWRKEREDVNTEEKAASTEEVRLSIPVGGICLADMVQDKKNIPEDFNDDGMSTQSSNQSEETGRFLDFLNY